MRVKWLLSAGRIEEISSKGKKISPDRYNSFVEEFGDKNIGLISINDLEKEIKTGKLTPVYYLGKNLEIQRSNKKGINGDIFLASGFDLEKGKIIKRENLEEILNYLEKMEHKGNIGKLINSKESTLFEDKISFVGLSDKGFHVPKTYNFGNFADLKNFIFQKGNHVVKHRFGYDGVKNHLINMKNIDLLKGENISDYVVQELLPIVSETRMIFYKEEFLGSRRIIDRTRPWEKKKFNRVHLVEKYFPSEDEVNRTKNFFRYSKAIFGSVDTVQLKNQEEKVLEFNGVATGLGYPGGPYDLNKIVANKLNNDY
jgi:hypothetical protein